MGCVYGVFLLSALSSFGVFGGSSTEADGILMVFPSGFWTLHAPGTPQPSGRRGSATSRGGRSSGGFGVKGYGSRGKALETNRNHHFFHFFALETNENHIFPFFS